MRKRKNSLKRFFKKFSITTLAICVLSVSNVVLLFIIWQLNFYPKIQASIKAREESAQRDRIFEEINPAKGYELEVNYGDIGPKMLKEGVIDLSKFKEVYAQNKQSLTGEQLKILTQGANKKIKITRDNSYFLLNFFWAVGLTNKSKILDEGDMVKSGSPENFASTGGWTLSAGNSMNYYSKTALIPLTPKQEEAVSRVASNIYRPCCDNSTAFPDCNHGMALLGVLQLLSSSGATEARMYEAAKYINAFWFPANYYDLAQYFEIKERKSFKQMSAKTVLGKDYSSATGYMSVKKWLTDKGIVKEPPRQGGSCGV